MDNKTLALAGAGTLFLGTFVPVISLPIVGSMNFFANGSGDGVLLIIVAAVAAGLAYTGRVKHVLWTGLASLAFLAFKFYGFRSMMTKMRGEMDAEMGDNPFRGLAEAAMNSIQLQWGWVVLLIGAGLLTYAGWAELRNSGAVAQPGSNNDESP